MEELMRRFNKNTDSTKTHYVAWSGGCDSSLLLYKISEELKKDNKEVTALISKSGFIGKRKEVSEEMARISFEDALLARKIEIKKLTIQTIIDQRFGETGVNQGYAQAGLWVLEFLPIMKDNSVIHFGYIKDDDFWLFDHHFTKMVEQYCKMLNKNITLSFDLAFYTKVDVISELIELDLLDKVWFCETPPEVGKACGNCHPCQTHKVALLNQQVEDFEDMQILREFIQSMKERKEKEKDPTENQVTVEREDTES
jgi:7-cyano-7-deazaguanine synthase in queuosine biosynthesis